MNRQLSEMICNQAQFLLAIGALSISVKSRLNLGDTTLGPTQPRRELVFIDNTFRVTVDQPLNAALQPAELGFQGLEVFGAPASFPNFP